MKENYLVIITNGYPANYEEASWLPAELKILEKDFHIILVPKFTERETDYLNSGYQVVECNCNIPLNKKLKFVIGTWGDKRFWKELQLSIKDIKFSMVLVKQILIEFVMSKNLNKVLLEILSDISQDANVILYSYWYDYSLISAVKCKQKRKDIKIVTRAHGFDLYKERSVSGYQCFKRQLEKEIDQIHFISEFGKEYYMRNYHNVDKDSQLYTSYLGTGKRCFVPYKSRSIFRIISCCYVIPLKRLDIIIKALSEINEIVIDWVHIGDGENLSAIRRLASELLDNKNNINYSFIGFIENEEVIDYYKNNYFDCFILISDTEGLPVSIMEAMAFGIPTIANNVGGVGEIVNEMTGYLLDPQPDAGKLADAIRNINALSDDDMSELRLNAYHMWERYFDSESNAIEFSGKLKGLVE